MRTTLRTEATKSRPWLRAALAAVSCAALFVSACTTTTDRLDDPSIRLLMKRGTYDQELCATAQRVIANSAPRHFGITAINADQNFVTEQMDADAEGVSVAVLRESVELDDGTALPVAVWCKMVNQDRVNDVLGLNLGVPRGTCREVNQLTYEVALTELSDAERARYLSEGRALRFEPDYRAVAGGEWLATSVSDFIRPAKGFLSVQAPSVQVPWPGPGGDWFEGTHHCKLITKAAMQRWMRTGAFEKRDELFPRPQPVCTAPGSTTGGAGSCLMYFGPAGGQFCQDYSGPEWDEAAARADCAIRHTDQADWENQSQSYDGGGGVFSTKGCRERGAVAETRALGREDADYLGTCVFRCNKGSEALWHQLSTMTADREGRMLERTCDLFIELPWEAP